MENQIYNCFYCLVPTFNDQICELCSKSICENHSLIEDTDEDSHLFCLLGNCDFCGNLYLCDSMKKCPKCNKIACEACKNFIHPKNCTKCN